MLKRHLLFLIPFSLFLTPTHAQTWEPVGKGIGATDTGFSTVHTMCVYSNKLYVGGAFKTAGGLVANNIASWNGKKWDTLSTGVRVDDPEYEFVQVNVLSVYHNLLCVAGYFSYAGSHLHSWYYPRLDKLQIDNSVGCIALWGDTVNSKPEWFGIGPVFCDREGSVHCVSTFNNNLYVGGVFDESLPKFWVEDIVRWNAFKGWTALSVNPPFVPDTKGSGYNPSDEIRWVVPNAMATYKNKLYIGSQSDSRKAERLASWDDTTFTFLAKDAKGLGDVFCLAVYDSVLYVGCNYNTTLDKPTYGILKYDGKNWSILEKDAWSGKGNVFAMTVWNNKLYIGGRFDNIAGIPVYNITCWDGKQFSAIGAGFQAKGKLNSFVHALCVYNSELYAGGFLFSSAGKPMMNIAKLNMGGVKSNPLKKKGMQPLGH